jgi:UDP-N-acetylmuramoyl-tripeptide--D-alanyl-D-alanine ligase
VIAARLTEIAAPLMGSVLGADAPFRGVSTDTRTLSAGQLFVALRGARFDANEFVTEAGLRGAAAAVVERASPADLPQLLVTDGKAALGRLGGYWRAHFDGPIVGITGSNGKTTVKEMVSAILNRAGPVLATRGNLNNDIGVPLTLCELGPEYRYAVVEMGANHAGEIDRLSRLAAPAVALITCCAPAHLEGFGSVEAVARAKAEIWNGLGPEGVAVINADDPYAGIWERMVARHRRLRFALEAPADVRAVDLGIDATRLTRRIALEHGAQRRGLELALLGRHNVLNAAAASACALALGLDLDSWAAGLQDVRAVAGRLQLKPGIGGMRLIDDTYNANPGSVRAALDVLAELPQQRWFVLGDMGELGEAADAYHRDMGLHARQVGIDRLFGVGAMSQSAVRAFGAGASHHGTPEAAAAAIRAQARVDATVLVKGSRSMRMERAVAALQATG